MGNFRKLFPLGAGAAGLRNGVGRGYTGIVTTFPRRKPSRCTQAPGKIPAGNPIPRLPRPPGPRSLQSRSGRPPASLHCRDSGPIDQRCKPFDKNTLEYRSTGGRSLRPPYATGDQLHCETECNAGVWTAGFRLVAVAFMDQCGDHDTVGHVGSVSTPVLGQVL